MLLKLFDEQPITSVPSSNQLFETRDIHHAVVQISMQGWEIGFQKRAVRVDGVAREDSRTERAITRYARHDLAFRLKHSHIRRANAIEQSVFRVHFPNEWIHS